MPKINKLLLRHFIRGYIDGDGWLTWRRNHLSIGVVFGSLAIIEQIKHWVYENTGLLAKIVKIKRKKLGKYFTILKQALL